jgi:hypothetical protein
MARAILVIADIGGYTRYLSDVELEHSTDVLAHLLQTVVAALEPNFRVAKVEGDAVSVYDKGEADGAVVVDALNGAYVAFMRRRRTIVQLTTCPCDACRSISGLGLKLVAHRGDYATHEIAGGTELVGRDVILVRASVAEVPHARPHVPLQQHLRGAATRPDAPDRTHRPNGVTNRVAPVPDRQARHPQGVRELDAGARRASGLRGTGTFITIGDGDVAGFALIESDSPEEAVELVSRTPCAVAHGVVEVWPLEQLAP